MFTLHPYMDGWIPYFPHTYLPTLSYYLYLDLCIFSRKRLLGRIRGGEGRQNEIQKMILHVKNK